MIKKDTNYIYNLDYIICIPPSSKELLPGFSATFNNVIVFNNTLEDVDYFLDLFKKSNIKRVIFVDNLIEYDQVIQSLKSDIIVDYIFTKSLAALSDSIFLNTFNRLVEKLNKGEIKTLGLLDYELYNILKKKYNVKLIKLRTIFKNNIEITENQIGILNSDLDFKESFYNELSAISKSKKYLANLFYPSKITKKFCKDYNINYVVKKDRYNNILGNDANLYINFTDSNILPFLDSMNNDIPCLLGNVSFLDDYPELKTYLVLDSDDDANEILEKLEIVIIDKKKVLKLYKKFISDYNDDSKRLAKEFIGFDEIIENEYNYDKLISVIVPIYNVEEYLENSLQSILNAAIDNMEILLINDGSTDNSAKIAQRYAQNHPDLIRYISQENHGLGNVRNVGLQYAKGKYIASIDSDDTINSNYFAEAIPYLNDGVDMVIYDWLSINPNEDSFPTPALDKMLNLENDYKSILYATIMPSACNKIVKKELYDRLNIRFAEGLKYEDLSTNPLIIMMAKSIKYINKSYYEYMLRPNSLMRSSMNLDMVDIIKMLDERIAKRNILDKSGMTEFYNYVFWWRIEELIINQLYSLDDKDLDKAIKYVNDNIFYILSALFKNNSFVDDTINKFDDETKNYIFKRNEAIINKELSKFIKNSKKDNSYKIITAAMILYNVDNREK